jgi:hypothetical protein
MKLGASLYEVLLSKTNVHPVQATYFLLQEEKMNWKDCIECQQYQSHPSAVYSLSDRIDRASEYAIWHRQIDNLANVLRVRIQQNLLILGE